MSSDILSPNFIVPRGERRARALRRWKLRSRVIGFFRRALPAAIASIVLGLSGWLVVTGVLDRMGATPTVGEGAIHMSNAEFQGRDGDGRPFVITADDAIRDNFDLRKITLVHPAAVMGAGTAKAVRARADEGVYHEDNRILLLKGHVMVIDATGESFQTGQAIVDTVKAAVAGDSPIVGKGPTGTITADSYAVYDRGEHLVFRGHVHSVLKRD